MCIYIIFIYKQNVYNFNLIFIYIKFTAKSFISFIPNYKYGSHIDNQIIPEIEQYKSKIDELKKQLNEENNKNKILNQENINLKNLAHKLTEKYELKIKSLNDEIDIKNLEIKEFELKIKSLNDEIDKKNLEIKEIESKMMVVNFVSSQDINNYSLICKSTDLFEKLEEKLFKDYPKYTKDKTFFLANGSRIETSKTLEENKIKNNNVINVVSYEN